MILFTGLLSASGFGVRSVLVGLIFAAGLIVGSIFAAVTASRGAGPAVAADQPPPIASPRPFAHPADVLRIIDGDTFEARVHLWPGLDVTTRVRLRGIDAPELHARCADEFRRAEAAAVALRDLLRQGQVAIYNIGPDKYQGRVVADVATRQTSNVSAAMISGGYARSYSGGHRGGWCASATP